MRERHARTMAGPSLSSAEEVAAALEADNAVIVDLRGEEELAVSVQGSVNIVWDKAQGRRSSRRRRTRCTRRMPACRRVAVS